MKPKIAVIGAGYWGKNLVRNFARLGALGIICENSTLNKQLISEQLAGQNIKVVENFNEVLTTTDISGVVIATPAITHYDLASRALQCGKDVYVEKPLSLRVSEGQKLCELAVKNGRILMVGHLLHYHPAVISIKNLIKSGKLGKLHHIYSHRLNLGKFRSEENVLWSFAPHDISIVNWIAGGIPERVMATGTSSLRSGIPDSVNCQLCFDGNLKAGIFASWLHPFKEQRLVVVGEQGMLVFDDTLTEQKLKLYPGPALWDKNEPVANKAASTPVDYALDEPLGNECRAFLDAIATRKAPVTDGREGVETLKVLQALQSSIDKGGAWCTTQVPDYFIHETAVADQPCAIGKGTRIWHFSHVMQDAKIGEGCNIGQNVVISPGVILGRNVKVQNNVSVYTGVICEDDVFLGPAMVFTNVKSPRSHIPRRDQYARTIIRRGASIGANATIVCGVEIGAYALVGAGAVVTKDVPAHALVLGNPASQVGWVCQCGQRVNPGQVCKECGCLFKESSS